MAVCLGLEKEEEGREAPFIDGVRSVVGCFGSLARCGESKMWRMRRRRLEPAVFSPLILYTYCRVYTIWLE